MAAIALSNLVRIEQSRIDGAPNDLPSNLLQPLDRSPTQTDLGSTSLGAQALYQCPSDPVPVFRPDVLNKDTIKAVKNDRSMNSSVSKLDRTLAAPESQVETAHSLNIASASTARETWRNPAINKWRVLSACLVTFANGFNDSAPGALLPYIEEHYDIEYAVVSIIFITNAVGFIAAAFVVQALDRRLGRATTLIISELFTALGFVMMLIPPPYAVFTIGFFVTGMGQATALALNNVYCANLAHATTILGFFHGAYGIGGTIAPIIATTMVTHGILFSRFYAILLGLRLFNSVCLGWTFWNFEEEPMLTDGALPLVATAHDVSRPGSRHRHQSALPRPRQQSLWQVVKTRTTLTGALFIFAYQGAEVSISGWIISFLITVRKGDPSRVGYVTAGFWAGITVGRFALTPLAHRCGAKPLTYALIAGSFVFEIIVWRLPSVIGDSVFVALIGLLLGPVYPCATVIFSQLLPRSLQNTALAFVSSAGSSGGAVAPFSTGLLAQAAGTWVLHPVAMVMYTIMLACWFGLPQVNRRRE